MRRLLTGALGLALLCAVPVLIHSQSQPAAASPYDGALTDGSLLQGDVTPVACPNQRCLDSENGVCSRRSAELHGGLKCKKLGKRCRTEQC